MLEPAYFNLDPTGLGALSEAAQEILKAHWAGDFHKAHELYAEFDFSSVVSDEHRALLYADKFLLGVKIGVGMGPEQDLPLVNSFAVSRYIRNYARFCYFFWVDHRRAWQALRSMALDVWRVPCSGAVLTILFLAGHLWTIEGKTSLGYVSATIALKIVRFLDRCDSIKPIALFVRRGVYSCYPFTLLVAGKLKKIHRSVAALDQVCERDPFYSAIFLASCLYAYAYSGDIGKTDLFIDRFAKLHAEGRLLRYQPISRIMGLLPLAMRGYGYLVRNDLGAALAEHDESQSDAIINSQFFRAAAIIALFLNDQSLAAQQIDKAVYYREKSESYQTWADFDRKVRELADRALPVTVHDLDFISIEESRVASARLGNLGLQLTALLPEALTQGDAWFEKTCAETIGKNLNLGEPVFVNDGAAGVNALDGVVFKIGSHHVCFPAVERQRQDLIRGLISEVAFAVRIASDLLARIRTMGSELKEASRAVTLAQTAQRVAHDVRKPFSILKIGLDQLRASQISGPAAATVDKVGDQVGKALTEVNVMLQDILDEGAGKEKRTMCRVDELIASATDGILVQRQHAARLEVTFGHRQAVAVNQHRLVRAIANIVDNACDAVSGQSDALIRIITTQETCRIRICIENNGPAISPALADRLFAPYATHGKLGGTGLGLAIAREVILDHGGEITARSEGGWTTFVIWLPSIAEPIPSAATTQGQHSKVALVDDNPFVRDAWVKVADAGQMRVFASPEEFFQAVEVEPGYLAELSGLITDQYFGELSRMDGLRFASALKIKRPDLPIYLSSDVELGMSQGLFAGIDHVIPKAPQPLQNLRV